MGDREGISSVTLGLCLVRFACETPFTFYRGLLVLSGLRSHGVIARQTHPALRMGLRFFEMGHAQGYRAEATDTHRNLFFTSPCTDIAIHLPPLL